MKSLKITLLVAVLCGIFTSLAPQEVPTQEKDRNNETIVKITTLDTEKIRIKVPNA